MDHDSVSVTLIKEECLPLWTIKDHDEVQSRQHQSRPLEKLSSLGILFKSLAVWIHLLLITLYTLFFLYLISGRELQTPLLYSPARDAVSYVTKTVSVLYNDTTNPFLQESGEGVGLAWQNLLQNLNIRLTADEMRAVGRDSVQLNDGSGDYLASLDVYHQLHCLKFLRSYIDENPLTAIRVQPKGHAYHCIELLRQVVQCHGDISVLTYDWLPEDKVPMPRWEIDHECVDWEALDGWAAKRRVHLTSEDMISHHHGGG